MQRTSTLAVLLLETAKVKKLQATRCKKLALCSLRHDEHARRQDLIVAALQAESDTLDTQISDAQQQRSQAQGSALAAAELALGDEWNRLAKQLAAVGSQILAIDHHRGSGRMMLSELSIPLFGPSSSELSRGDVPEGAQDISLADLIEA